MWLLFLCHGDLAVRSIEFGTSPLLVPPLQFFWYPHFFVRAPVVRIPVSALLGRIRYLRLQGTTYTDCAIRCCVSRSNVLEGHFSGPEMPPHAPDTLLLLALRRGKLYLTFFNYFDRLGAAVYGSPLHWQFRIVIIQICSVAGVGAGV